MDLLVAIEQDDLAEVELQQRAALGRGCEEAKDCICAFGIEGEIAGGVRLGDGHIEVELIGQNIDVGDGLSGGCVDDSTCNEGGNGLPVEIEEPGDS